MANRQTAQHSRVQKDKKQESQLNNFVPAKGTIPVMVSELVQVIKKITTSAKRNTSPDPPTVAVAEVTQNWSKKCKATEPGPDDSSTLPSKKVKVSDDGHNISWPLGFVWDGENYSCAYDALFTILLSIWSENPSSCTTRFKEINTTMKMLASDFRRFTENVQTLETA
jgi:hypothetical protein